ncbi:hypothetical protein [Microvirga makkahensis]|uniref:Uncharacterized protein n=1 Tax=Microvirga makkahensis TaxID=1128670 RepID=A0A7X3MWE8_9HYPH|nr:hypothetical protein [Microvirga makkahensis]MXQ14472.1 hypothetical protein [Microvirga makkahensis]
MTDEPQPSWSEEEIAAYVARYGLKNLTPEHLVRLRELAENVARTGSAIPRMASKYDEPAHVFHVHLD